jgi:CSLREA domain-containing protein
MFTMGSQFCVMNGMKATLNFIKTVFLISLLAGAVAVKPAIPTRAAGVFNVNSTGDAGDANPGDGICATQSGVCTLRAAIEEANKLPGVDEIYIPAMHIVVGAELRTLYIYGVDTSVIIHGAGENQTIIDGGNAVRIFYFDARSGDHAISDLTIQNANNSVVEPSPNPYFLGSGGGIFSEAGLTLTNVMVRNCTANQGGGIYSRHAFLGNVPYLTMNSVTILENVSTTRAFGLGGIGGGGIYSGSLLNGDDVVITDNSAITQGGGIYHNSMGSLEQPSELTNFIISNNTAADAAGINNDLGVLNLHYGEVSGNYTSGCRPDGNCTYTGGAGIYNNEGTMNIDHVKISDNRAAATGGIGGGIYNYQYMTLTNVSVTNNRGASGAGIFNGNYTGAYNHLTMTNVTVGKNVGVSNPPIDAVGAGIYNVGVIDILNSTISENSAVVAGGIKNTAYVYMLNTILAANTASYNPDCRGALISQGNNILGNSVGCNFQSQSSDKVGVDPALGTLTGDISYYPLLQSSPAIDAGSNNGCPETDVRGIVRPQGQLCDIGTYEKEQNPGGNYVTVFLPTVFR